MDKATTFMMLMEEENQYADDREQELEVFLAATVANSPKRRRVINRRRLDANERLMEDYFVETPTYGAEKFRARYRMSKETFMIVLEEVVKQDDFFTQKMDVAKRLGFSSIQKVTAALRMLAYGCSADQLDENLRIGKTTALECLRRFCKAVIAGFGESYLRAPNQADVERLLKENAGRGFPGMLGSLDCMHWEWKNCPTAWHGQFRGKEQVPTIILEAVASYDLWIWHAFFGLPGTLIDINVLDRSDLLDDLADGKGPAVNFTVNNRAYKMGYYLTDGINHRVVSKKVPYDWGSTYKITPKQKLFTRAQEAARKDVERAFGVLQQRFRIVAGPARIWDIGVLDDIMTTCIILHNLIVERQREGSNEDIGEERVPPVDMLPITEEEEGTYGAYIARKLKIVDRAEHLQLREYLATQMWNRSGDGKNQEMV
ncbi:hypothetical protein [Absidia glauca]|uniref:DDE Tnp4 domain-containing protein n=1 Tax=Absidia glauca TaxID=4829 RepID=A0A168NBN2_ABSGL|nr:hypothetical protein [Absidia glauca]